MTTEKTYNGLSAYDFMQQFGYHPEHNGVPHDQETLGDSLGMSFEEFFGDVVEGTAEETTELGEALGEVTEGIDYNLYNVEFHGIASQTHKNVERALEGGPTGKLRFYSEPTGRGKTTGIVLKGIPVALEHGRVLIATREVSGVEDLYRMISRTYPSLNVKPWSGVHRKMFGNEQPKFNPVYKDAWCKGVTNAQAKEADVVVTTHAAAKSWVESGKYDCGKDFGTLIIDEYPDPVRADTVEPQEIMEWCNKADNKESRDILLAAGQWLLDASNRKLATKATWADRITEDFRIGRADRDGLWSKRMILLAENIKKGNMFFTKPNYEAQYSLSWAELLLPFQDRAIIFSATNSVEGWQFNNTYRSSIEEETRGYIPTDYQDSQVVVEDWPSGVSPLSRDATKHAEQMVRYVKGRLNKHFDSGLPTMVLVPKAYVGFFENYNDWGHWDKLSFQNWGAGIGSNKWKDYEQMLVVSLFHPNKSAMQQNAEAHSGDKGELFRTLEEAAVHTAKKNHHTRWIVQMLNRVRIREMQGSAYVAKSAKVVWISTHRDAQIVEDVMLRNFRGIDIQITDETREKMNGRQAISVEAKILGILVSDVSTRGTDLRI